MRVIDRIQEYIKYKHIAPYTFERNCAIANGYLKKQSKGKGTVGSEIIEKITSRYKDISLTWLLTGKGPMLVDHSYKPVDGHSEWNEQEMGYMPCEQTIKSLREKILILESALADKEKIIRLLEGKLETK
jgi:hypothetical protein